MREDTTVASAKKAISPEPEALLKQMAGLILSIQIHKLGTSKKSEELQSLGKQAFQSIK